jgi:hypothetical protein
MSHDDAKPIAAKERTVKRSDRRHADSSPARVPRARLGPLDEARALFEKMAGEVTRRSEVERQVARARGPVARVLLVLTIAAALLAAATMFYGVYNFPDAPLRQTAGGYEGKGGRPRTQEDFAAFIAWEKMMIVVFPAVFGLGFAFAFIDARQRRKGER